MAKETTDAETTNSKKATKGSNLWKRLAILAVIIAITVPGIKYYISGGVCRSKARMDDKFVIITGANTGIGKETARDLAGRGARVLMACRSQEKCSAAADDIFQTTGYRPEVKVLDLADLESVTQFSQDILKKENKLHVLINNAGVMMCPRLESKQGYELQFATNHLGHFLLTNLLLPLLKNSSPSRVVVVSSKAYQRGVINFDDINSEKDYGRMKAYSQSKLANILFANELAKKLEGAGVTVTSLHPGVIDTDLPRHILEIMPGPVKTIFSPLLYLVKNIGLKTPMEGAQTQICCAVSEDLAGVTGKYFSDCEEMDLLPNARDEEAAKRLWEISEKMVGIK